MSAIDLAQSFVAESSDIERTVAQVRRMAPLALPILVQGEPGTGKELLARTIHALSPRGKGPFERVSCGELPPDQVVPRLFGHAAGALPGTKGAGRGAVERSSGGTLFLDEIDELSVEAQNRLREVLSKGVVHPLGATKARAVDVRIVASSCGSLMQRVRDGAFRLELYYLLAVGLVRVPPLRERPRDLDHLVDRYLATLSPEGDEPPTISASARALLHAQSWHGNVRELENVMKRVVLWSAGGEVQRRDVEEALDDALGPYASDVLHRPLGEGFRIDGVLAEVESHYLRLALHQSGGNKARAAALLGLNNSTTLSNRMEKHGVR